MDIASAVEAVQTAHPADVHEIRDARLLLQAQEKLTTGATPKAKTAFDLIFLMLFNVEYCYANNMTPAAETTTRTVGFATLDSI
ncbi:hypothetical protein P0R31_28745 [Bradyrhizobium yuanmingense]|uniref:hypothetical protein n=1 Tax=Bradyrhizobium yuanmingense TaxID=108015 RepID=UPI0023B92CD8|nr:hypothetical protein [Bradyrhizobium yuanmingense]MDF0521238.1 hypothetical protein [Bradyrhizobium yuanmingense]